MKKTLRGDRKLTDISHRLARDADFNESEMRVINELSLYYGIRNRIDLVRFALFKLYRENKVSIRIALDNKLELENKYSFNKTVLEKAEKAHSNSVPTGTSSS